MNDKRERKAGFMERARMPIEQRAKQFMPFYAVAGLDAALKKVEYEMGMIDKRTSSDEEADGFGIIFDEFQEE